MSYETGAFGSALNPEKNKAGEGSDVVNAATNNHYGVRETQDSAAISGGEIEGGGAARDYVVYFTGDEITTSDADTGLTLPAGSVVVGAVLEIVEAITMSDGTVDIEFGTNGEVGTNGVQFDNTNGAVGTYAAVSPYNGTFAAGSVLAADTDISMLLSAGTAAGGKGKVVFTVRKV